MSNHLLNTVFQMFGYFFAKGETLFHDDFSREEVHRLPWFHSWSALQRLRELPCRAEHYIASRNDSFVIVPSAGWCCERPSIRAANDWLMTKDILAMSIPLVITPAVTDQAGYTAEGAHAVAGAGRACHALI